MPPQLPQDRHALLDGKISDNIAAQSASDVQNLISDYCPAML
jgi:hypothetical protein